MTTSQLITNQEKTWAGEFGRSYTDRNPQSLNQLENLYVEDFGMSRTELNNRFLMGLDREIRILEVGSNVGTQLQCLQSMGFSHLYGIELQRYAVELAKSRTTGIDIINGSAFDIPYKNGYFDLVFTSGVLIHIHPDHIHKALKEIHRCSSTYIWGFEYFAEEYTGISYRGNHDLLWKTDFAHLYTEMFDDLELVNEERIPYLHSSNEDSMFLLKKRVPG